MAEEPAHGARVEAAAASREEQGIDCVSRQLGTSVAQVARYVMRGLLA